MDLNKLVTKRIKEYALDSDVDLLDKYGFLFNMIANEYLEAINYTQRVSICLERAKKYARHQHFLGTQGKELVEFDDWKAKD